jgi:hypothetical protein
VAEENSVRPREATPGPEADRKTLAWWRLLYTASLVNIALWSAIAYLISDSSDYARYQLILSGVFVAACAFRSALPRVDLERLCLWNNPLSSIFLGRSVATLAELCFSVQCSLLLLRVGETTGSRALLLIGWSLVPLIAVAQLACWYAVLSLNHLGHALEEILWAVMLALLGVGLALSWSHLSPALRPVAGVGLLACAGGVYLMLAIDVPMYVARWRASRAASRRFLTVTEGVVDSVRRRRPASRWSTWRSEVPWMSLYFTVGVWWSLVLVVV